MTLADTIYQKLNEQRKQKIAQRARELIYYELAQKAGLHLDLDWCGRPSRVVIKDSGVHLCSAEELLEFAELVAKHTLGNKDAY